MGEGGRQSIKGSRKLGGRLVRRRETLPQEDGGRTRDKKDNKGRGEGWDMREREE